MVPRELIDNAGFGVPPNPPWAPIAVYEDAGGYLSYFYNDDLSWLPVRAITKIGDNKVDPNLETKTYGLFSPCNKAMRKSIVKRGCQYIFFVTMRKTGRVLSGLYLAKWYATVAPDSDDFCLAADRIWFVEDPIPLSVVDKTCATNVSRRWRACLRLNTKECKKIESLLKRRPNATRSYLTEIDRLERFNLKYGGYRYISARRKDSYYWDCDKVRSLLRGAMR